MVHSRVTDERDLAVQQCGLMGKNGVYSLQICPDSATFLCHFIFLVREVGTMLDGLSKEDTELRWEILRTHFKGPCPYGLLYAPCFMLLVRIFMMKNSWSDAFVFSSHIPGIWGLSLAFCFGVLYSVCVLGGGYSQSFSLLAFPCLLCGLWAALVFLIFGCWDARQQKTHEFEEGKSSEPRSRSAQGHLGSSIMLTVQGNCSRRPQTTIRALWPYRRKPKSSPRPL